MTTDHVAVLARLAAKLKHMRLQDIEEVTVIGLSESEVELQVMTCEDEECVVGALQPVDAQPGDEDEGAAREVEGDGEHRRHPVAEPPLVARGEEACGAPQ